MEMAYVISMFIKKQINSGQFLLVNFAVNRSAVRNIRHTWLFIRQGVPTDTRMPCSYLFLRTCIDRSLISTLGEALVSFTCALKRSGKEWSFNESKKERRTAVL